MLKTTILQFEDGISVIATEKYEIIGVKVFLAHPDLSCSKGIESDLIISGRQWSHSRLAIDQKRVEIKSASLAMDKKSGEYSYFKTIENIWEVLKRKVYKHEKQYDLVRELDSIIIS